MVLQDRRKFNNMHEVLPNKSPSKSMAIDGFVIESHCWLQSLVPGIVDWAARLGNDHPCLPSPAAVHTTAMSLTLEVTYVMFYKYECCGDSGENLKWYYTVVHESLSFQSISQFQNADLEDLRILSPTFLCMRGTQSIGPIKRGMIAAWLIICWGGLKHFHSYWYLQYCFTCTMYLMMVIFCMRSKHVCLDFVNLCQTVVCSKKFFNMFHDGPLRANGFKFLFGVLYSTLPGRF